MRLLPIAAAAALATTALLVTAHGESRTAHEGLGAGAPKAALQSEGRAHVSIPEVSLDVFAGLASSLVLADVVESRVLDQEGLMLRTELTLSVLETYFGDAVGTVRVQVPGGATATRRMTVPEAPELVPGSRHLIFLGGPVEGDSVGVLGLARGCYRVVHHGARGALVRGHLAPTGRPLDGFVEDALAAREALFAAEVR